MTVKKDSIAAMRAALLEKEEKSNNQGNQTRRSFGDNARYPFWDLAVGKSATLRFLPDADPDNIYFWKERFDLNLPFEGIKGQSNDRVTVQVPCMKTWGKSCPVISETRKWWDDESTKALARQYYFKRQFLYQGFVVNSDLEEAEVPENPIRRFTLGPQIHKIIEEYVKDPDIRYSPTDFENGMDFKISKKQNGQFSDYSASNWTFARGSRALNDAELEAIEKYNLYTLKDFLPKEPGEREIEIIKEMFEASYNGEEYDPDRFAEFYRPRGLKFDGGGSAPYPRSSAPAAKEETVEPIKATTKTATDSAQDLIADLKRRRGQSS